MAPLYYHGNVQPPRSVAEIVKEAEDYDHKGEYPLRIALRAAQSIRNQAANYERDGNVQDAYLFYYRHISFYQAQIHKHPEVKKPEYKQALARIRQEFKDDIARLEALKPEVNKQYERYQEALRRREESRTKVRQERESHIESQRISARNSLDGTDGTRYEHSAGYGGSKVVHASEHADLALQLAQRELRRRGIVAPQNGLANDSMDELSRGIRDLGRRLERPRSPTNREPQGPSQRYHYPSVPAHDKAHALEVPAKGSSLEPNRPLPDVPPKQRLPPQDTFTSPPPLPSKPIGPAISAMLAPPPKEELASSNYTFKPAAFSESGAPLRTVFLPTELRSQFLSLAIQNTRANLETCGILCGSLISNALFVSHLVIPDQVSTSDTCEMTDEGEIALFDYVDGEDMIVCGWIHTHPSQTCFLSSRDLHTSVGYQVMLPESVAIVCAPSKDPDHGIFRLTDPPGKDAILACHKPGIFHPHDTPNLYTGALRPGHVSELTGLQFQVVDLRKKK